LIADEVLLLMAYFFICNFVFNFFVSMIIGKLLQLSSYVEFGFSVLEEGYCKCRRASL